MIGGGLPHIQKSRAPALGNCDLREIKRLLRSRLLAAGPVAQKISFFFGGRAIPELRLEAPVLYRIFQPQECLIPEQQIALALDGRLQAVRRIPSRG